MTDRFEQNRKTTGQSQNGLDRPFVGWGESGLSAKEAAKHLENFEKEAAAQKKAQAMQDFMRGLWSRNALALLFFIALFAMIAGQIGSV